jgi:hypothetical protein
VPLEPVEKRAVPEEPSAGAPATRRVAQTTIDKSCFIHFAIMYYSDLSDDPPDCELNFNPTSAASQERNRQKRE